MGILNIASVSGSGVLYVSMAITGDLQLYTSSPQKTCCYAVRHTDAVITHSICAVGAYSVLLWSIFGPADSGQLSGASRVNSNDTLSLANVEDLICAQ